MRNWVNFQQSAQKSEKLYINGFFLSKELCFGKKTSEGLCVMTLKGNAKFKEKATCGLKNHIRNLVNFVQADESLKICTLIGSFCPKHIKIQMIKYKRVLFHDTEECPKFEEKLTFGSKNGMRNLVNFNVTSGKSESYFLMCYFSEQHITFQLKNYRRSISRDTEKRSKLGRKTDFLFEK